MECNVNSVGPSIIEKPIRLCDECWCEKFKLEIEQKTNLLSELVAGVDVQAQPVQRLAIENQQLKRMIAMVNRKLVLRATSE